MCPKLSTKHVENGDDSALTAIDANVVKKREQAFVSHQLLLDSRQSIVLPQAEKRWHEGVSLFTPFTLVNLVDVSSETLPQVCGRRTVELADEGQDGLSTVH